MLLNRTSLQQFVVVILPCESSHGCWDFATVELDLSSAKDYGVPDFQNFCYLPGWESL